MKNRQRQKDILFSIIIFGSAFAVNLLIQKLFTTQTLVPMIFVFGVFLISLKTHGYCYGITSAIVSVFAVNFAFTYPYYAFDFFVEESILSAVIMLVVAVSTSTLNIRIRDQEKLRSENEKERMRGNLLRAISHDLRTPLTSISGNADILLSEEIRLEQAKRRQLYTDIYEASMWLISLVENLLSITRIEDGTMNLNLQVELVDEVVEEALKHLTRKSTEHIITFQPSDEILLAKMDSRLIMQVVINLVDNAVKYTPPGSRIEVTTEKKGEWVCVSVSDNGNGITDEMKEKIFDMFYTGTGQASDSRRGLGLGLFLVKAIIQAHGGTIRVKDGKTDGTIFTFRLKAEEVTLDEQTTDSCSGR